MITLLVPGVRVGRRGAGSDRFLHTDRCSRGDGLAVTRLRRLSADTSYRCPLSTFLAENFNFNCSSSPRYSILTVKLQVVCYQVAHFTDEEGEAGREPLP